jgi:hypothetical protein
MQNPRDYTDRRRAEDIKSHMQKSSRGTQTSRFRKITASPSEIANQILRLDAHSPIR